MRLLRRLLLNGPRQTRAPMALPFDVGSLKIGREAGPPGRNHSSLLVVGKLLLDKPSTITFLPPVNSALIETPAGALSHRRRCESHSTDQRQLGFSYPEGNFEGNQLLGDSMSLSPLHQTPTNELHVSIETSFHRSFPRLRCFLE